MRATWSIPCCLRTVGLPPSLAAADHRRPPPTADVDGTLIHSVGPRSNYLHKAAFTAAFKEVGRRCKRWLRKDTPAAGCAWTVQCGPACRNPWPVGCRSSGWTPTLMWSSTTAGVQLHGEVQCHALPSQPAL